MHLKLVDLILFKIFHCLTAKKTALTIVAV